MSRHSSWVLSASLALLISGGCSHLPGGLGGALPSRGNGTNTTAATPRAANSAGSTAETSAQKKRMDGEMRAAWDKTEGDARDGLRFLEQLKRGNDFYSGNVLRARRAFDALAVFDAACKKYNFPAYTTGVSSSTTSTECALATETKATAQRYFGPALKKQLEATLRTDRGAVRQLQTAGAWVDKDALKRFASADDYMQKLTDKYKALVENYGVTLDPTLMAELRANAEAFVAGVAKAGKVFRMPKGLKKAGGYAQGWAKETLGHVGAVKGVKSSGGWAVQKNASGYPEYKRSTLYVLVRPSGAKHCFIFRGDIRRTHEGRGKYGAAFVNNVARDLQISRCN